jgi:hypothetical protein
MKKAQRSPRTKSGKLRPRVNARRQSDRKRRRLESAAPGSLPIGTQQVLMGLAGFKAGR